MYPPTHTHRPERSFAIIGHPIGHSLSPTLYETAFRLLNLPFTYQQIDIAPDRLAVRIAELRQTLAGFNVTIPHKQAIIPLLDRVSGEARSVGAVNTVINQDGKLTGYNTDIDGITASLAVIFPTSPPFHALILGAGGSARAVLHVLVRVRKVPSVTIAARNGSQSHALARDFGDAETRINAVDFSGSAIAKVITSADLLVNTTPIGMHPNEDACPLAPDVPFPTTLAVFDLIYRPRLTTLLRRASAAGCSTIGGLEMLIHQGKRAFDLYTSRELPVGAVRDELMRMLTADETNDPR